MTGRPSLHTLCGPGCEFLYSEFLAASGVKDGAHIVSFTCNFYRLRNALASFTSAAHASYRALNLTPSGKYIILSSTSLPIPSCIGPKRLPTFRGERIQPFLVVKSIPRHRPIQALDVQKPRALIVRVFQASFTRTRRRSLPFPSFDRLHRRSRTSIGSIVSYTSSFNAHDACRSPSRLAVRFRPRTSSS